MTTETQSRLPLFYVSPEPLNAATHVNWRLKAGNLAFAAEAPYVPVVVSEMVTASHHYPLVFAAGDAQPVALLGLSRHNLFVSDGEWSAETYVPTYIRRYPFGFMQTVNPDGFVLAIDAAASGVVRDGEEGEALFADGQPSALTRQALQFCEALQHEAAATRAFADALQAQEILIDRRADATLPDGRTFGLDGFQIVDAEKFAALDEAVVLDWHRQGWLALVYHHLASLAHFQNLLDRQGRQPVASATYTSDNNAPVPA